MKSEQPSPLGALLVRTRKRAALTQEALAERAGVSVNTISNLEAGRGHLPRPATLDLVADALATALALEAAERTELQAALRAAVGAEPQAASTPHPPPSGIVTFLVCRPVDPPAGSEETRAAPHIRARLAALLQRIAPRYEGRLVDPPEGPDGAVCTFTLAEEATLAACAIQRALWDRPGARTSGTEGPAMMAAPVCLALHTGRADAGAGFAGPTRRRAVRLARLGHGGQLLFTAATRELVQRSLPEGVRTQGVGQHSLSAVERPQPVWQLVSPTVPGSFPALRALALPPTNLPVQLTSLIGREQEQAAVGALLGQGSPVTLVGAGGCGKTRLALAVAAELLEDYPDGAWLVELAALAEPELVPQAVATALGLREEAGQSLLTTLCMHLKDRRLLLVLDNCEHLLPACAELAGALLRCAPHLHLLATSRERLGIGGEVSYRVPSLALPAPAQQLSLATLGTHDGVRLFVERARAVHPDFGLSAANAGLVAQICRRLDGLPLAIELAAARVGSLPLEALAARLEQSLGMLTEGPRDAPPRQQTLRATLDWSWSLLAEPQQHLLRRLAVFAGGWTVEAAEAVCGGADAEGPPMLRLLGELVSKSLVELHESGGSGRYGLLETVRQYARDRLAGGGEDTMLRDRHLTWCMSLAEEAEPQLIGPDQGAWLERLETEHDNLRAALSWARERGEGERGLRLAGALWRFWNIRGYLSEGRAWLEMASTQDAVPAAVRAVALNGAGNLAFAQGDYGRAAALHREALALRRELEDTVGIANSLNNLGNALAVTGDFTRATSLHAEALALRRSLGDRMGIADSLNNLGSFAVEQGDLERASALHEEALVLRRELGDASGIAMSLRNLGNVASAQGDYDRAAVLQEEALALRRELGDRMGIADSLHSLGSVLAIQGDYGRAAALYAECLVLGHELDAKDEIAASLEGLAWVAAAREQPDRAARLGGAAEALRHALAIFLLMDQRAGHEQAVRAARSALGEERFAAAWTDGRALPLEEAIALAREDGLSFR